MTDLSAFSILSGMAAGRVVATREALSFWGGVDPGTGEVIDIHHPLHGTSLTGSILMMPASRGSCSGSGVLLDLILTGRGPAALIFTESEDVLTLGAIVAAEVFGKPLPVARVSSPVFEALEKAPSASITGEEISFAGERVPLTKGTYASLELSPRDEAMLSGAEGKATQQAMRIICAMAVQQGSRRLIDVSQGHIDGCIYASPANLTFAEAFARMGARVRVPTTMNAISVDRTNWQRQGTPPAFGGPAARLADAYVQMGCAPTFTCSPYLLESAPSQGDAIAWSESNAVIYANSVIGARTAKHPDFLDLCIAITGRAPESGVYLEESRRAQMILDVDSPCRPDDAFWPLIGYLAGKLAPDCIPLVRGLAGLCPSQDDLKALCAAFGTTSAAPMLHIEGITPESALPPLPHATARQISRQDMLDAWEALNGGPADVDLVAIGSPHASASECRALCRGLGAVLGDRQRSAGPAVIVTAGRQVISDIRTDGTLQRLNSYGVQVLPDLCWCSISEPVFPAGAHTVMTNSGKYAHYGPGLSGRKVRLGSLSDCIEAAIKGRVSPRRPDWLWTRAPVT
ncbi:aconitase X [Aestuariivirga sp.]|uniref:cis-3-hydroxy-L-proline dehydratase n=1 Tax=Aestuariivirga sp. TaxID=2650926 RepID=UPI00391C9D48